MFDQDYCHPIGLCICRLSVNAKIVDMTFETFKLLKKLWTDDSKFLLSNYTI